MPSCVLAYSGGLDTSVILGWLQDEGYTVHCVYVDLGQPCEDREAILHHDGGEEDEIELRHTLSADQIEWFKAGSALNVLKKQKA